MSIPVMLYLALLLAAVAFFLVHFLAQWRFTAILRARYPDQWKTITEADTGRPNGMANWLRIRRVLRSDAPALFNDDDLNRWQAWWRRAPWLAWPCWAAAMALQWWASQQR
ncbi:hypothetical protein [Luteibacter sp. 9135]|uniref:hypothetical protein n=1 Tax=Luteibacter sp. 9135 TaxID=1500893 RepID=UPI00055B212C|nr:hypothetical protein [Luteibacter sp. 9135]